VAAVLAACCRYGVPLKFTAGLHQPIAQKESAHGAGRHGFINVFIAGVLAQALGLEETLLAQCIAEEDATAFQVRAESLGWRHYRASAQDVMAARGWLASFGSCSFAEPVAALKGLGWID